MNHLPSPPEPVPPARPRRLLLSLSVLACFLFVQTIGIGDAVAAAATPPGTGQCEVTTDQERFTYLAQDLNWASVSRKAQTHQVIQDSAQLQGGIAYVDNHLGAVVAKIPAKYLVSNTDYEARHSPTIIMAVYDPQTSVGSIWVDRSISLPDGDLLVEQLPFGPTDGVVMSYNYDHNNPFWQFIPGANGNPSPGNPKAFVKIGANAFFSAVGMVLKQFGAQRGLIASLKVRSEQHKHTSGSVFYQTTTITEDYYGSPQWTLVLPSGAAPGGYTTGYSLPICSPVAGMPLTAGSASAATAEAVLWSDSATEAGTGSVQQNGQTWAALTIPSGVEYIDQGALPLNIDTSEWLAYTHSESHGGLGILSFLIIAVVVSVVTWGAGAAALAAASPALGTAITAAGSAIGLATATPATIGAVVGAGLTAASTVIQDAVGINSYPAAGGAQTGFFYGNASNQSSLDPNIESYNLNAYLASLHSTQAASGVSTVAGASDPTNPSTGFNGDVGALTQQAIPTNQLNAIGSLGVQANDSLNDTTTTVSSAPSWAVKKTYLPDTGSTAGGALPTPPQ